MSLVVSIFGAIAAIFVIIILHELGHFFVARGFGVKILRFSIGFGKALYKHIGKDGTEYVLAIIPLGGYVKMLGENDANEVDPSELHRAFNRKPLLVRMAVVLAGPLTNFILAIVVFYTTYMLGVTHIKPIVGQVLPHSFASQAGIEKGDYILKVGSKRTYDWQQVIMQLFLYMGDKKPVLVTVIPTDKKKEVERTFDLSRWKIDKRDPKIFNSIGMLPHVPSTPPVIQKIIPQSPAANAHLRAFDQIVQINETPIHSWDEAVKAIEQLPDKPVTVTVLRDNKKQRLAISLGHQPSNKNKGYLGVMAVPPKIPGSMISQEKYNLMTAWKPAVLKTWMLLKYNWLVLEKLVTHKLSFKVVGGPISIFQAAGQATHAGAEVYLSFIGFISLAIGFINLLPIPGLDGGVFLFQVIEAIIRRPVPEKIQAVGFTLGMLFVIFIVLNATINDLYRLFS